MISIIIINKNDPQLVETLISVDRQTVDAKFEIIVVDRSTCKYQIPSLSNPLVWIKYVGDKKYTIPQQRNLGVRKSKGNIIVFIDASCIANPGWLEYLTKPITNNIESIVMGKTGSVGKTSLNDVDLHRLSGSKYVTEAPTINLAIKKDVFSTIGFFDESLEYGSDIDFTWRAIDSGFNILYEQKAFVAHNWGSFDDQLKRAFLYGKAKLRLIVKHFDNRGKSLLGINFPLVLYPILIVIFPLYYFYPWLLIILGLLILKNISQPWPIYIVLRNLVFAAGELQELIIIIKARYVK